MTEAPSAVIDASVSTPIEAKNEDNIGSNPDDSSKVDDDDDNFDEYFMPPPDISALDRIIKNGSDREKAETLKNLLAFQLQQHLLKDDFFKVLKGTGMFNPKVLTPDEESSLQAKIDELLNSGVVNPEHAQTVKQMTTSLSMPPKMTVDESKPQADHEIKEPQEETQDSEESEKEDKKRKEKDCIAKNTRFHGQRPVRKITIPARALKSQKPSYKKGARKVLCNENYKSSNNNSAGSRSAEKNHSMTPLSPTLSSHIMNKVDDPRCKIRIVRKPNSML